MRERSQRLSQQLERVSPRKAKEIRLTFFTHFSLAMKFGLQPCLPSSVACNSFALVWI
jgi:hypothetical protein